MAKIKKKLSREGGVSLQNFDWPSDPGYWLRYSTFIPMEKAPNLYCVDIFDFWCEYEEFSGDVDLMNPSFRTRTDTFITL